MASAIITPCRNRKMCLNQTNEWLQLINVHLSDIQLLPSILKIFTASKVMLFSSKNIPKSAEALWSRGPASNPTFKKG